VHIQFDVGGGGGGGGAGRTGEGKNVVIFGVKKAENNPITDLDRL